jgi:AcrR family transcriptional regulator
MDINDTQEARPVLPKANSRPSIREEQKQRTRDRLLAAASEVFGEVGFRAATIDQIMKRAEANRATFYLHFSDKMDVAAALGRRAGAEVAERFRRLDNLVAPTRADVRAWLEEDLAWRRANGAQIFHEAVTSELRFAQDTLDYFGRVAERMMTKTLARWPEERRRHARSKMVCLMIMMDRVEFHLLQGLDFRACDPLDALTEFVWNELFAYAAPGDIGATAA